MSKTAVERTLEYAQSLGISITAFERSAGLSNGYLKTMQKRGSSMGAEQMEKVLNYCPELSEVWLLTGNGPMLKNTTISQENNENAVAQNFGTIHNTSHHSAAVDANHYVPRATYDDLMDKCHQLERRVHELTDEIISLSRQLIQIQANK